MPNGCVYIRMQFRKNYNRKMGGMMKNAILSGFQQIGGLRIIIVPIFTAAVIMLNLIDPLTRAFQDGSFFSEGFHIEQVMKGLQSEALSSFLPILAALPFGGCFVDDLKSKFARFFLIRSSYRTYIASRIIVGFLAGGLAILSGALIAWGTTAVVLIPMEQEIEGMEPAVIDGLIEICLLLFVNGGFWSVVGMAMSTLMESKYISYATPFVFYYLLVILYERYFSDLFIIYPKTWTDPSGWPFGFWGAAIFLLEMTLIFAFLFAYRAGRRLQQL